MSLITFLKLAFIGLTSLSSCLAAGPAAVALGAAGNFTILAQSGISSIPSSSILGSVGISPSASTYVTGFSLILSPQVITAFNDANGCVNPTAIELGTGGIGGLKFAPGLYKWTTGVNIATDITISGTSTDTWIFQIAGTLSTASTVEVTLAGGMLPQNIIWVVSGAVTLGSTSVVNSIILGATSIALNTGATVNGCLLSQTAVTLGQATVNAPA